MMVVVPLSAFLRLISLFPLRVLRVSLCCAERLSFSFENVVEEISCVPNSFLVPLKVVEAVASLI